ncbi:MAG TPA: hypothetical protein VFO35_15770 [Steroidobacteraceae bacterium]|nr:hypothetical protein [Steroidobacteraceae bacterium]
MRTTKSIAAAMLLLGAAATVQPSWGQKAGQSISIQYGKVTAARDVDLSSGAVPAGALVGGALGLATASGKSSSKKARNAIVGAAAGGAIAGSAQGSQKGKMYQVELGAGDLVQVVSDQHEIRTGDCVAVEKAGDTANIRRVSASYCEKGNAPAVKAVAGEAHKDAQECAAAKQQLVDAKNAQEADLAGRKIALLCND